MREERQLWLLRGLLSKFIKANFKVDNSFSDADILPLMLDDLTVEEDKKVVITPEIIDNANKIIELLNNR